jgi:hypothetical protein
MTSVHDGMGVTIKPMSAPKHKGERGKKLARVEYLRHKVHARQLHLLNREELALACGFSRRD